MLGPYREPSSILLEKKRIFQRPSSDSRLGRFILGITGPLFLISIFFLRGITEDYKKFAGKIRYIIFWTTFWILGILLSLYLFNIINVSVLTGLISFTGMIIGMSIVIISLFLSFIADDNYYIKHPFVILPSERIFLEKGKGDVTSSNVHPGS